MNVDWFDQKNANKTFLFCGAEESLVFYRTAPSIDLTVNIRCIIVKTPESVF